MRQDDANDNGPDEFWWVPSVVFIVLFLGSMFSAYKWYVAAEEVFALDQKQASMERYHSNLREEMLRYKWIAGKVDEYIVQEVHDAQMETLAIAEQLAQCERKRFDRN